MGELSVCLLCGAEFVKTRPGKKYCSRKCAVVAARRAKFKRDKDETVSCPHNVDVLCNYPKCNSCGWNPVVAKARLKKYLQKQGGAV